MNGFNPVPKPEIKKKRKKQNGWKNKRERCCYYCGTLGAERHEVYGGHGNRQISIDHEFQVDLCRACHEGFTNPRTEKDMERIAWWKRYYQEDYEKKLREAGATPKQARDCWMKLIGKSYLEPIEEQKA